jgi:hypothetical protein
MKPTEKFNKAVRELQKKNQQQRKAPNDDAKSAYRVTREMREAHEKELAERCGESTARRAGRIKTPKQRRNKSNWY